MGCALHRLPLRALLGTTGRLMNHQGSGPQIWTQATDLPLIRDSLESTNVFRVYWGQQFPAGTPLGHRSQRASREAGTPSGAAPPSSLGPDPVLPGQREVGSRAEGRWPPLATASSSQEHRLSSVQL